MEQKTVRFLRLDPRAVAPAYATPGAAAADLCAVLDAPLTLEAGQRAMIPTGLAIELPGPDCVALLYARSGLAIKHGLTLPNCVGVIDSDYRGENMVPLHNDSGVPQTIRHGDRVAQMVVLPYLAVDFLEADALDETERGEGGFGSTGR